MTNEPAKACAACKTPAVGEDGACARCGWNATRGERRCLRCRELVEPGADLERLKLPGGVAMVVAVAAGMLGGFLGSLALFLAVAAVGSVLMAQSMRYRCTGCATVAPERALIEGERNDLRDRRATLWMRAGLMAAGSAIAGFLWLHAVMAASGAKVPGASDPSAATAGGGAPDIAALEAAKDAEALAAIAEHQPLHREAATAALQRLGDNAVPALLGLLSRADEHGKRAALSALGQIAPRTERAIEALTGFVRAEPSTSLRAQAIGVLGKAGASARSALPVLEPLLGEYALAGTAEAALRKIAPETDWRARRAALRKP